MQETRGDVRTLLGKLYGQEKNLTTSSIARMNLFLHGAADFQIVRGDTLRNPAFFLGDSLATFDCVIANPLLAGEMGRRGRMRFSDDRMAHQRIRFGEWIKRMLDEVAPGLCRLQQWLG